MIARGAAALGLVVAWLESIHLVQRWALRRTDLSEGKRVGAVFGAAVLPLCGICLILALLSLRSQPRSSRRRLRMRPGLTCLWAISGRDNVDFETWMKLDMQYIDNWSLALDWKILLQTIPRVLTGRGAN